MQANKYGLKDKSVIIGMHVYLLALFTSTSYVDRVHLHDEKSLIK